MDDELSILRWLRKTLEDAGYDVLEAADVPTAIGALESSAISALILDVRLVGGSGLQLLEFVRFHHVLAELPVIIFTGVLQLSEEEEDAIRRYRAYVIYKPAGTQEVIATLDRLIHPADPSING